MADTPPARPVAILAQCNDHPARLAGIPAPRFFTDAEVFARTQVLVQAYYGFDVLVAPWDVYNIEAEALGQKLVYHDQGIPDAVRNEPLIRTQADLDRLRPPDPYRDGRMPWVHQVIKRFAELTGRPARAYFCAPFSLAVNIRGYENLLEDIYDSPEFVHRLFTFLCDEVLAPYIQSIRDVSGYPDLPADGNDAWASPPMISPDMVDEFVVAYTLRLREKAGTRVVTRGNWGDSHCRDLERFLDQKLECSPGFLGVLDPDLHAIGAERIKAFADKRRVHVTAGIDARLLREGPVEAIVDRVKQYIDAMARDGRGVVMLNQIPAETPPEHIHAAVAACRAYGRFPMPDNLDEVAFELPRRESFAEFLRLKGESIT
ncbi:MAG: hypothetical protein KKB20_19700 [Proteobacteria bacterium]|nr:hypothetical protein [Pseudomonadota bacterium]